ncbi:MAG: hypothetical protein HC881_04645 [Leptolyngbyaceae cyanobacterium SL_7_1]|nr:hypothetical protein [Leptolyngbyaceae cyanobacterium SL_7_1]
MMRLFDSELLNAKPLLSQLDHGGLEDGRFNSKSAIEPDNPHWQRRMIAESSEPLIDAQRMGEWIVDSNSLEMGAAGSNGNGSFASNGAHRLSQTR